MCRKVGRRTKNGLLNDWPKNIEIKSSNAARTMRATALRWKWNITLSICEPRKTTVRCTFSTVDLGRFDTRNLKKLTKENLKKIFFCVPASPSQKTLRRLRDTDLLPRRLISILRRESTSTVSLVCHGTGTFGYRYSHRSIGNECLECSSLRTQAMVYVSHSYAEGTA